MPHSSLYRLLIAALLFGTALVAQALETVTLAWDPNPESDVIGYQLYYGTASGIYTSSVNAGNATEIVISGLEPDTTYYVVVTAYNAVGLESFLSDELAFKTASSPAVADGSANLIFLEAEAGAATAPMSHLPDAAASGGIFVGMGILGQPGGTGQLRLEFEAPAGLSWQIWGRVRVPVASQGIFVLSANDGPAIPCRLDPEAKPPSDAWTWVRFMLPAGFPISFTTTGGTQRLVFHEGDPLTGLDRIILSADPEFIPPSDLPSGGDYLTLTTEPRSLTGFAGLPVTLSVTAAATGAVHYQWYRDNIPLEDAQSPSLPLEELMPDETATFRVVATLGSESVSSGTASVTVLPAPVLEVTPVRNFDDSAGNDSLRLEIKGRQFQELIVEYTDDLMFWNRLTTFGAGTEGPDSVTDAGALQASPQRFYRLSVP